MPTGDHQRMVFRPFRIGDVVDDFQLLNAVVAAYYYLRVLVTMYMREPEDDVPMPMPVAPSIAIVK